MLKILEAQLEQEGREQGLKDGLKAGRKKGRLRERIANIEGMRKREIARETVESITGVDGTGLHKLRGKLDRMPGDNDSDVD